MSEVDLTKGVYLSNDTYDRFHNGYVALVDALGKVQPFIGGDLAVEIKDALAMKANLKGREMGKQRIWVSEDRCTLLTIWYDTPSDYIVGKPANVTIARRDDPGHTWGPPVTLTEEVA